MLRLQRLRSSDTALCRFMEKVLTESFPVEEYRELAELRALTETEDRFHNNLILDGATPVGLLTWWDFGRFHYVEHFAIAGNLRNRQYGQRALALARARIPTPLVLEVEQPVEETARRRIRFYERQGFALWDRGYLQPPYRPGADALPMRLMACGDLRPDRDFTEVRNTIHREVYHAEQPVEQPSAYPSPRITRL